MTTNLDYRDAPYCNYCGRQYLGDHECKIKKQIEDLKEENKNLKDENKVLEKALTRLLESIAKE